MVSVHVRLCSRSHWSLHPRPHPPFLLSPSPSPSLTLPTCALCTHSRRPPVHALCTHSRQPTHPFCTHSHHPTHLCPPHPFASYHPGVAPFSFAPSHLCALSPPVCPLGVTSPPLAASHLFAPSPPVRFGVLSPPLSCPRVQTRTSAHAVFVFAFACECGAPVRAPATLPCLPGTQARGCTRDTRSTGF